jgi:hypothetical protein
MKDKLYAVKKTVNASVLWTGKGTLQKQLDIELKER